MNVARAYDAERFLPFLKKIPSIARLSAIPTERNGAISPATPLPASSDGPISTKLMRSEEKDKHWQARYDVGWILDDSELQQRTQKLGTCRDIQYCPWTRIIDYIDNGVSNLYSRARSAFQICSFYIHELPIVLKKYSAVVGGLSSSVVTAAVSVLLSEGWTWMTLAIIVKHLQPRGSASTGCSQSESWEALSRVVCEFCT